MVAVFVVGVEGEGPEPVGAPEEEVLVEEEADAEPEEDPVDKVD